MAPRLKLNIANPLPTISEAREDIKDDISSNAKGFGNVYTSSDSCCGEDYLQSICQLARPPFPAPPQSKHKVQDVGNDHKASNQSETRKIAQSYQLTDTPPHVMSLERFNFIFNGVKKAYSNSRADPLEELYTESQKTHQERRPKSSEDVGAADNSQYKNLEKHNAVSFPTLPFPRPVQTEDSCPEIKTPKIQGRMPTLECCPRQKENDTLIINGKSISLPQSRKNALGAKFLRYLQRGQQPLKIATGPEKEQLKFSIYKQNMNGELMIRGGDMGYFHIDPNATNHHWISKYQCAWKEAKVKVCLLPAIAES